MRNIVAKDDDTLSHFADHAGLVRYSIAPEGTLGLRRPQAGAVHAVAAHFALRNDPALVCMPTGSGKTLVMLMCPYALECRRALVLTPSTILRGQIAENCQEAAELRAKHVLPEDVDHPVVHEVRRRVTSAADWDALREADIVVATPHTVSKLMSVARRSSYWTISTAIQYRSGSAIARG